jgi:glutamine amidotransferase
MAVAIINYGMGNVASVEKALKYLSYDTIITNDHNQIEASTHIFLPGVGSFAQGITNLNEYGLIDILNEQVLIKKKPFFGICLGMQLIATKGHEPSESLGLGWIDGEVIKMEEPDNSIPHLGWNNIYSFGNTLTKNYHKKDFYFIHSYHFKVQNKADVAAEVEYGSRYVAAIHKGNIFATQFHPEKSQHSGLGLMKSFFDFYA